MRKTGSKLLSKAGVVLGIMIIGGSVAGGIVFATGGEATTTDSVPTVPLGNSTESTPAPPATVSSTPDSTSVPSAQTGGGATIATQTRPAPSTTTAPTTQSRPPTPTPTDDDD